VIRRIALIIVAPTAVIATLIIVVSFLAASSITSIIGGLFVGELGDRCITQDYTNNNPGGDASQAEVVNRIHLASQDVGGGMSTTELAAYVAFYENGLSENSDLSSTFVGAFQQSPSWVTKPSEKELISTPADPRLDAYWGAKRFTWSLRDILKDPSKSQHASVQDIEAALRGVGVRKRSGKTYWDQWADVDLAAQTKTDRERALFVLGHAVQGYGLDGDTLDAFNDLSRSGSNHPDASNAYRKLTGGWDASGFVRAGYANVEAAREAGADGTTRVFLVGDSLSTGAVGEDFKSLGWTVKAQAGQTAERGLNRLGGDESTNAERWVIQLGTNNSQQFGAADVSRWVRKVELYRNQTETQPQVTWVLPYRDSASGLGPTDEVASALKAQAAGKDWLTTADWPAIASQSPGLLQDDGVQLTPDGQGAFYSLVTSGVGSATTGDSYFGYDECIDTTTAEVNIVETQGPITVTPTGNYRNYLGELQAQVQAVFTPTEPGTYRIRVGGEFLRSAKVSSKLTPITIGPEFYSDGTYNITVSKRETGPGGGSSTAAKATFTVTVVIQADINTDGVEVFDGDPGRFTDGPALPQSGQWVPRVLRTSYNAVKDPPCDDGRCVSLCAQLSARVQGQTNGYYKGQSRTWAKTMFLALRDTTNTQRGLIGSGEEFTPPIGAMLFWNNGTYGHVATYVGDGKVVTNYEPSKTGVVVMPADRLVREYGSYLGWMAPPKFWRS